MKNKFKAIKTSSIVSNPFELHKPNHNAKKHRISILSSKTTYRRRRRKNWEFPEHLGRVCMYEYVGIERRVELDFRSVNPKSIEEGERRKGVEIRDRVEQVRGVWSFWTAKTLIWREREGERSKACQAEKIDGGKKRRPMEAKKYKNQVRILQCQTVRTVCVCVGVCVYAHVYMHHVWMMMMVDGWMGFGE